MKKISILVLSFLVLISTFSYQYKVIEANNIHDDLVRVIVEIDKNKNKRQILRDIHSVTKARELRTFNHVLNGYSFEINRSQVENLELIDGVKKVNKVNGYYKMSTKAKEVTQILSSYTKYHNRGEGMVISVIDSGIDPNHKDMNSLNEPQKAKLSVDPKCQICNIKVPYGYNFVDNSYNFKDMPNNSEHGIHVAAIASASGQYQDDDPAGAVEGVASQAQVLGLKVFSNNPDIKTAYDDDILAAIEKSIEMKVDVINMSLGNPNGFVSPQDPIQQAIKKASDLGILVVVAAGNNGTSVYEDNGTGILNNTIEKDLKDIGMVASPATVPQALAVASSENSEVLQNEAILKVGNEEKYKFNYVYQLKEPENITVSIVHVNEGQESEYKDKDVNGKVVLIKRGTITFVDKINIAKKHGAKAAIIYNHQEAKVNMELAKAQELTTTLVAKDVGEKILELLKQHPDLQITLSNKLVYIPNVHSQEMSIFSSWGSTNNLDFKPEITGVGGQIYSASNDNKYRYESGTSMAAPQVAGSAIIALSELKKLIYLSQIMDNL